HTGGYGARRNLSGSASGATPSILSSPRPDRARDSPRGDTSRRRRSAAPRGDGTARRRVGRAGGCRALAGWHLRTCEQPSLAASPIRRRSHRARGSRSWWAALAPLARQTASPSRSPLGAPSTRPASAGATRESPSAGPPIRPARKRDIDRPSLLETPGQALRRNRGPLRRNPVSRPLPLGSEAGSPAPSAGRPLGPVTPALWRRRTANCALA